MWKILFLLFFISTTSPATEVIGKLVLSAELSKDSPLSLNENQFFVYKNNKTGLLPFYKIEGKYAKHAHAILFDFYHSSPTKIDLDKTGNFSVSDFIDPASPIKQVRFVFVDEYGFLSYQKINVEFIPATDFAKYAKTVGKSEKINHFSVGLGTSFLSYTAHAFNYTSFSLTGKFGYFLPIGEKWSFKVSSFMTLLPLIQSQSDAFRFFGLSTTAGYKVYDNSNWKLNLHGGGYYTTTIVSNNNFGITNLAGPVLFFSAQKILTLKTSFSLYLKTALIMTSSMSPSNHEIAIGGAYNFHWNNTPLAITLDLSKIDIPFLYSDVNLNTATVGVSFSF